MLTGKNYHIIKQFIFLFTRKYFQVCLARIQWSIYYSMGEDFLDYNLVSNIILFINVIICLSYPLNFAIYCGMSRWVVWALITWYNFLLSLRQFRTTFRTLFLTPIRNTLCKNVVAGDGAEQENTDAITGNKSRYFISGTAITAITLTLMLTEGATLISM